jgi:uncharacterized protein YggE
MKPMLAGLAAVLFLTIPALADGPTPTLTADGRGTEMVVPDIAVVTIGVESRGRTASAALAANSTDLTRAIGAIRAAGVADRDIGTSGFGIDPVYAEQKEGETNTPPPIIGYQVSNSVTVTIRDIAKSGGILDAVVNAGANQVNGISFDVSDPKAAHEAALKAAIAEALAKGELMADAAGVRLVRVLSVATAQDGGPRPMFLAMAAKAAPSAPVMPGQQSLDATATISWEIAPK